MTTAPNQHSFSHAIVLTLAMALGALGSGPAQAQVGPNAAYFEIDGDYGDWLEDTWGNDGEGYLPALDVNLLDQTRSWGRRQSPCDHWAHTTVAPYMGAQSYRSRCEGAGSQRRTEQKILALWYPDADDTQRYFSLAFRLIDAPEDPNPAWGGYFAQLHQDGSGPPPFRVQWEYMCPPDSTDCQYYVNMGVRWGPDSQTTSFQEFGPPVGGGRSGILLSRDTWYRMLFRISLVPDPQYAPCPGTGEVQAWLMDATTGQWTEVGYYSGPMGYEQASCNFDWKVGIYANNEPDLITLDYDNVAYGKRWNNITRNRLVGYSKTVLDLWCDEGSGSFVNDHSYWWNGGQPGNPVADYNNDGTIAGTPLWNGYGVANGGSLRLNGGNYVVVPMDDIDFDFGNYCTAGCWFRTTNRPADNKGLIFIDEFSSTWKVKLYMSDANLSFGVRHTDGSVATVNYAFPAGTYADGEWHQALGTFNRFTQDGQRLKLYVDGQKVLETPASDLPMLRGEDRLVVGKYSVSGFFVGDIDEVLVRNYAMTEDEVSGLYEYYVPSTGVEAIGTREPPAVSIRPNPSRSQTAISFALSQQGRTTLTILDPSGRVVARPLDQEVNAGKHEIVWDGRDRQGTLQPSGVYFYRLESSGWTDEGRIVLIR